MKRQKQKPRKTDRRIERTRSQLREALLHLVIEKGYEATTVQDILDRANLGRSTFYAHFHDKDELLVSGLDHLREVFEEQDARMAPLKKGEPVQRYSPAHLLFHHVGEHRRLYKALMGQRGGEIVQRYLYKYMGQVFTNHMRHFAPADKHLSVPRDLLVHYVVTTFLAMMGWWLERGASQTPDEMAEIYMDLVVPSLNAILRKG